MTPDSVRAIVVAVPARDEEQRIVPCVVSLLAAIERAHAGIEVAIVVASDGSTDATDDLVDEMSAVWPSVIGLVGNWGSAGGARRAAVARGLDVLAAAGHHDTRSIWIATTDADSTVPDDWLLRHLGHAEAGHDAIAGIVELIDDHDRTVEVAESFASHYVIGDESHTHVHGANLGVRASAYLAAGGFPAVSVAEDHALWNELRRQQFRVRSPIDLRVSTSGRLVGRAIGGFADTLAVYVEAVA